MRRSWLVWMGALLGLAVLAMAARVASPLLEPPAAIELKGDSACDLQQGPCSVAVPGGGSMTLAFTPRPISAMQPFRIEVMIAGSVPREVTVDLRGADMDMGLNRFSLGDASGGRFAAQAVIPVCVRQQMLWEARVFAVTEGGRYVAPFRFATSNP
jgi:hypothetical protein